MVASDMEYLPTFAPQHTFQKDLEFQAALNLHLHFCVITSAFQLSPRSSYLRNHVKV